MRTRAPFHSQPPHGVVLQLVLFAKPAKVTVAFWAAAEPASAAASRVTAVYCIDPRTVGGYQKKGFGASLNWRASINDEVSAIIDQASIPLRGNAFVMHL